MTTYHHILVPTDGSALSLVGARQAVALAKDLNARVTAVFVVPPWAPPYSDESTVAADFSYTRRLYEEQAALEATKALGDVQALAQAADVPCDALSMSEGEPWKCIIDAAQAQDCDLIVMASHGRGNLGQLLLGSQTTQVLSHSKTPVLVCR